MSMEPVQLAESGANPAAGRAANASLEVVQTPSRRVLEPIERISEVLFGLIMVLTFTCTFSVAEAGRSDVRNLLLGALGCNLAWGIIDGFMYLMGCLADKARSLGMLRGVQGAEDPEKGRGIIAGALPPVFAEALSIPQLETIRGLLRHLPPPPLAPRLTKSDWAGAAAVFVLVFLSTCPVVLPFALLRNAMLAQRLSNVIAICLMFSTGYGFGRCTGYHPLGTGVAMVLIGGVLVGLTIALGG